MGDDNLNRVDDTLNMGDESHAGPSNGEYTAGNESRAQSGVACQPSKKRKRTPVVEVRQGATTEHENSSPLHDSPTEELRKKETSDEEVVGKKVGRKKVVYRPFELTDECPDWFVGDVFRDREFVFDVVRQYAVMTRRPMYMFRNDKEKMRAKCHGINDKCEWFVYFRKNNAFNAEDYVVITHQKVHSETCSEVNNNWWISSKWLGKRYTEKIRPTLTSLYNRLGSVWTRISGNTE